MTNPAMWEQLAEAAGSALVGLVFAAIVFWLTVAAIFKGWRGE